MVPVSAALRGGFGPRWHGRRRGRELGLHDPPHRLGRESGRRRLGVVPRDERHGGEIRRWAAVAPLAVADKDRVDIARQGRGPAVRDRAGVGEVADARVVARVHDACVSGCAGVVPRARRAALAARRDEQQSGSERGRAPPSARLPVRGHHVRIAPEPHPRQDAAPPRAPCHARLALGAASGNKDHRIEQIDGGRVDRPGVFGRSPRVSAPIGTETKVWPIRWCSAWC